MPDEQNPELEEKNEMGADLLHPPNPLEISPI
jgi:hypothetical protein